MMKKTYVAGAIAWGILVLVCIVAACCESVKHKYTNNKISYTKENCIDSIKQYTIDSITNIYTVKIEQLTNTIDSIKNIPVKVDTVYIEDNEALLEANYKLERIRYYNNIAGKKNNIKFLRGWINRVLDK